MGTTIDKLKGRMIKSDLQSKSWVCSLNSQLNFYTLLHIRR